MHEYLFRPEVARVALVVGVVVSMLFYERVQLTTGGAIVPAYLALHLPAPLFVAATLAAGYVTYYLVSVLLARRRIIYGRRKFEVEILTGLAIAMMLIVAARSVSDFNPTLIGVTGIGFLIPGVLAHDMYRQKPRKTVIAVMSTTLVLGAFVYVFDALIAIAPGNDSGSLAEGWMLTAPVAFPPALLIVAVVLSVLIGMVVFSRLGLRSGGFVTGAYLAFVAHRPFDIAFALGVAFATWLVVVHLLMPHLLLFGRRKLSSMILVGAILSWVAELVLLHATDGRYVPWVGLVIITFMVPALIANDAQRQGWERTLWGAAITSLGVYALMTLLVGALAFFTDVPLSRTSLN